ncbi:alpha/beta fold hydrolase [Azospirillum thermophilum]|uniref:Alpha/beta hydrolase n=1 Tax=Azospirillum thermophilum TaxID=2202148 RepID=A0A2S2CXF1_9PROT|nr:alpha/beta hydrolase [Azospirillum thermophilum]AWK89149.1 alpha/beta hydrolase [Azospirillum thermophilum]
MTMRLSAARRDEPGYIHTDDGTKLFYRDWGRGEPVVFLASWSLNSDSWGYQMLALAERGYRCVAYDRRGHGRSSDPGRGYEFDRLADDLACLLDRLDLHGVTLVGHSMSCGEIVRYLTRHGSGRVARTVLVGTATPALARSADTPDGIDPDGLEQFRTGCLMRDFPKWLADNIDPFLTPDCSSVMKDWVRSMALQASMKALLDCHRATTSTDFRAELAEVTVPTLVVHGDLDVSSPLDLTGRRTAALMPNATLALYEGAPHGLFLSHMERFNRDLLGFLESSRPVPVS